MKDLLSFYYYMVVDKITMLNHNYYFKYLDQEFAFYRVDKSLEELELLFNLNIYMINNNYKINKIIINKDRNIRTLYKNHYYVLVLLEISEKTLITVKDILDFSRRISNLNILNRCNWYFLWSYKIDNIEYTIEHIMHKYKILYNTIYYYIGLTENALTYLNLFKPFNDLVSISHNRVLENTKKVDFYNPLNLVIDYRIRDLAEYFKSCFFENKLSTLEIINYLKRIKMTYNDSLYFYIRMLFLSYYFDYFDLIINERLEEKEILNITLKSEEYEYLLFEIYRLFKNKFNILGIDWINDKYVN